MRNQNLPIATEGLPFIAGFGGVALLLFMLAESFYSTALIILSVVALFLATFSVYFFRNPHRAAPQVDNSVISPADGVVIFLGDAVEPHLDAEMTKISIFMSVFNVHINRVPVTGRILDKFYVHGKFLDVRDDRSTFENERSGLVIETMKGVKIVVVQVAGLIARRIVCYPAISDMIIQGQRYGLIRFGSRLDVYIPKESEIRVKLGEKTIAGETILGILQ
jgi:phosphatidylserine decarboxylase